MKRLLMAGIVLAFAVLAFSTAVWAGAPSLVNYQGRLTNSAGEPLEGVYLLSFRIYDDAGAGSVLWSEIHPTVTVKDGLFNVTLGNGTPPVPLTDNVFSGTGRWLGIKVGDDAELAPRTQIVSVGYSHRVGTIDGASGGTISGVGVANLELGSPTLDGDLELYNNGTATSVVQATTDSYGGAFYVRDEAGINTVFAWGDGHGEGGEVIVRRTGNTTGIHLEGNYNGTDEPRILIDGSARYANFNMSLTGDASVALPDNAISAVETHNEPGIAAANSLPALTLGTTMTDIETVSLTIPTAGYIVLTGHCWLRLYGTTSFNGGNIQIDETAGGSYIHPYFAFIQKSAFPSTGSYWEYVSVERVYYKTAGTYTFRLEGMKTSSATGTVEADDAMLTAVFYPTSYGSVTTMVTSSEAVKFEKAVSVPARDGEGELGSPEPLYEVNLRELEIKEARLKAELEEIQRAIDKAESEKVEVRLKELNNK